MDNKNIHKDKSSTKASKDKIRTRKSEKKSSKDMPSNGSGKFKPAILINEKRCLNLLDDLPVIIYEIDPDGYFVFVNNSIELLDYKPADLIGKHFSIIIHPDDLAFVSRSSVLPQFKGKITGDKKAPKLFDERRTGRRSTRGLEIRLIPKGWEKDQEKSEKKTGLLTLHGEVTSSGHYDAPVDSDIKQFLGTVGIIRDLTEKMEAEAEIKRLSSAMDQSIDGVAIFRFDLVISYANEAFSKMHSFENEELLDSKISKLYNKENEQKLDEVLNLTRQNGSWKGEFLNFRKDGTSFPTFISTTLLKDNKGKSIEILMVCRDITEWKKAEEQIRNALTEKELLLKEIHHRTKNNLQVISSLLKLQAGYIENESVLEVFTETRNRIKSMSLVHEKLYRSEDLAVIDFENYIKSLASQLFASFVINSSKIRFQVEAKNVFLGIDTAIPCGLIINELVSNALKHAFPNNMDGVISIELTSKGKEDYAMLIQDNGMGFPKDIDFKNTASLGLQIVNTLVKQLKGSIEIGSCNSFKMGGFKSAIKDTNKKNECKGTAFLIKFKRIQYTDGRKQNA
ncbi:PAS domain S-box protein [bacterium]|nr:PAS domain S-box protein [bacterium]